MVVGSICVVPSGVFNIENPFPKTELISFRIFSLSGLFSLSMNITPVDLQTLPINGQEATSIFAIG